MAELSDWKVAITLPIIDVRGRWSLAALERVMTKAVRSCVLECRQVNGDAICTTLSGGLDSSFCLAKIRQLVGPEVPIHTFTVGGSVHYPDVQFARIVSRCFNTIHHELIPSSAEIRKAEEKLRGRWKDEASRPGSAAVFLAYQNIAQHNFKCVIAHDGIDELLGGYWEHRKYDDDEQKKAEAFRDFWDRLEEEHLLPLERKAQSLGVKVVLPYLQKSVVEYIARIPLRERTSFSESKIPLRVIAKKYLPREIVTRKKKGFCSALDKT